MKTKSGSLTITIGNCWWEMSVVGGKSAPWLIWRSGHVLPDLPAGMHGRYNKPGFRIDMSIGSTGTCLPDWQACLQPCLPARRGVYVCEDMRRENLKSSNQ